MKLLPALLLFSLTASAQSVTRLAATKANDYGIAYSLPETTVKIVLNAEKTVKTPGVFYNYAERYLGVEAARRAIVRPSTTWTLTGAKIYADAQIPSGAQQYLMQFKGGQPIEVLLSQSGVPLSINSNEVAPKPVKIVVDEPTQLTPTPLESPQARYAVTEDMLQGSSLAKRAQFAADQIIQLRQSRQDYLTGQADQMPDGKALELILANLQAQEEALTAMFLGTTQYATDSELVSYIPSANGDAKDQVIGRLNPLTGFVGADDLSGAPIYLTVKTISRGKLPLDEKGQQKAFPKGGVPYAIAGTANFSVDFDGRQFDSKTMPVTQLGVVFGLDPAFFTDKKNPGYAIFDQLTGGLVQTGTYNPAK